MSSNVHPVRHSIVTLIPPYVIKENQGVHSAAVLAHTNLDDGHPSVSSLVTKDPASAVNPLIPQPVKFENEEPQRNDGSKMGKMLINRRKDTTISTSVEENSEEDKGNVPYLYIIEEGNRRFQNPQLTSNGFLDTSETKDVITSSGNTFISHSNSDTLNRPTEISSSHTSGHQRPNLSPQDVLPPEPPYNLLGSFSPITTYKPKTPIQLNNNNNNKNNNNNNNNDHDNNNNNNDHDNNNNNNNNNNKSKGTGSIDLLFKPEKNSTKVKTPPHIRIGSDLEAQYQEELADFSNLFHHQKSVDELAKRDKEVAVREDEWLMTKEGSTAVILVGMCSVIMMLICFIFLLKKWRRENSGKGGKGGKEHNDKDHHHKHDENDFDETVLGRLWFTVVYDDEKSDLRVNIMHARYPNGRGVSSNTGEVWVEGIIISAMNTIKGTSRTSTRRATYSPVFNHNFLYMISKDEVKTSILKLVLHDRHPKKGERQVGSIILPLSSVDLSTNEIICRDLL